MDEAVIKFYRGLLRTRFEHAGSFENASIFLDTIGDKVFLCGKTGDFMQLYVNVVNNRIDDIKYNCNCDPPANVAVEILCTLIKGKTLEEAFNIPEESFFQILGGQSEEMGKRVKGLKELLNRGITRYRGHTLKNDLNEIITVQK
jgi:NifU-like protein involved in Fe-S cluster formation